MRPWIPTACVVTFLCLVSFGCAGGAPSNAGATLSSPATPVTSPVTNPVTTPVTNDAAVSVVLSDPAACKASGGPWAHVYVTIADVKASTNADAGANDPSLVITVPLLPSQSPYNEAMVTVNGSNCAGGADCAPFAMQLPTSTPNVVACSEQTAQFKQQQGSAPRYTAESVAAIPGTGSAVACSTGRLQAPNGAVTVGSGETAMTSTISFTQCQ